MSILEDLTVVINNFKLWYFQITLSKGLFGWLPILVQLKS
jgi:hypothetical protein